MTGMEMSLENLTTLWDRYWIV